MIGVDTNILVRAVLEDAPEESILAKAFIKKACAQKQLFVSCFAILEMVWVLKGKNHSRHQISESILYFWILLAFTSGIEP
jgi:predicted nucleic-acid-binding protein